MAKSKVKVAKVDPGMVILAKINQSKATEIAELLKTQKVELADFKKAQKVALQELMDKQTEDVNKEIQDFLASVEKKAGAKK